MTESEAKEMLKAYMECDKRKNDVAYEKQCHENCDNCNLCYAQGTVGEHKEAVNMAIKALEKQKKIKEAFTHYAFNGYDMNVLNDCAQCLADIKDILNGGDEE